MNVSELIKKLEAAGPALQVAFEVQDSDTSYTVDTVELRPGFLMLISENEVGG